MHTEESMHCNIINIYSMFQNAHVGYHQNPTVILLLKQVKSVSAVVFEAWYWVGIGR